jgi:hypothetical protein
MNKWLIFLVFVSVFAQETTHVVREGDTLWDIAGYYYQDPFLWPYIWRANLTKIEDPHWIYPDQEFVIPPSPEGVTMHEYEPEYVYAPVPPKKGAEIISFIEPETRVFTEEMIHRAGYIVDEDIPIWARIVGTEPEGEKYITSFKKIYIDRVEDVTVGDMLTVYRPGDGLSSPRTGEYLGKEILILGIAEVEALGEEGSRCKVIASYDIIKEGDLLIPYDPILAPEKVELISTTKEIEGQVVKIRPQYPHTTSVHVFVYIDHGEETGIAVGDVFDIYQKRNVGGKEQPDFNIGKTQIISVFRNASIGLLLEERETVRIERGELVRLAQEAR